MLRGLGKAGIAGEQIAETSFVGEIGNLGTASLGLALALGFDAASRGRQAARPQLWRRRGRRASIDIIAEPPSIGIAEKFAGEAIDLWTYYLWTRGRQAEPH